MGATELLDGSCEEHSWCRAKQQVAALWRTGGTLRVNGFRLPDLTDGEAQIARFSLRTSLGSAGRPFTMADLPGSEDEKRSVLSKLVLLGAIEKASSDGK